MYCRLIDGSLVTLSKAKYARTDPQILSTYHVPLSDINGAIPLGLDWQTWTISGVIADSQSIRWHDIIWLSLDNIAWRACRVQATAFPTNNYQQSTYELTVLVSPILEGAAVRYPTTGYKWGNQSITGISQLGNTVAHPIIHYLAPLFYAPFSNTLIDFTGQAVTFTRTAAKTHNGVVYPINTPIFDNGLYLASDGAPEGATWTPPVSALRTIAMQIKSRYPSPWSIGGGGINLLTPNQSNAEAGTTGMGTTYATVARNTVTPIAGAADFKATSTLNGDLYLDTSPTKVSVVAGQWYAAQVLVKFGNLTKIGITWYTAANAYISRTYATAVACPTITLLSVVGRAPATAAKADINIDGSGAIVGDSILADSLMIESIPTLLTIWSSAQNVLRIDTANNRLQWTDTIAANVFLALPAAYMSGMNMDVVVIEDIAHAVTIAVHPGYGDWISATGTLADLTWPQLTLGNLEGSISNLIQYPYVLSSAEYQTFSYSSLSLAFWGIDHYLFVGNRYAGEIVKGSDGRLVNASGADISALLGGTDIAIGASAVTIAQAQGLAARWYVEIQRTDV